MGVQAEADDKARVEPAGGTEGSGPLRVELAVQQGLNRCPYCHEACTPLVAVACVGCLGRHHDDCWLELGACAACGGEERLVPERLDALRRTDSELFDLLQCGRREEVEAYLMRCQAYAEETRARTSDEATRLAFDRLTSQLGELRFRHQVVGVPPLRPSPLQALVGWAARRLNPGETARGDAARDGTAPAR